MASYRLLIVSNESGSVEDVVFLDPDNDDPAEDYCQLGDDPQTVDFDGIIEADLPTGFPVGSSLRRREVI